MSNDIQAKLNNLEAQLTITTNYKNKKEIKRQISELRKTLKENELKTKIKEDSQILLQHSGFAKMRIKMKQSSHEEQEQNVFEQLKLINYDTKEFNMLYVLKLIKDNRITYKNDPISLSSFIKCEWDNRQQSKFIEKILLGRPLLLDVNLLDLGQDEDMYELLYYEDIEKLKTIYMFLSDFLRLQDLTFLNSLNGLTFDQLASSIKRKFSIRYFRVTVFFYKRFLIYNEDYKLIYMFDNFEKKMEAVLTKNPELKYINIKNNGSKDETVVIQKIINMHMGVE